MVIVADILNVSFPKAYKKEAFEDIRQMAPAGDTKRLYKIFVAQKVGTALGILFLCNACFIFSLSAHGEREEASFNGVSIERPDYALGDAKKS